MKTILTFFLLVLPLLIAAQSSPIRCSGEQCGKFDELLKAAEKAVEQGQYIEALNKFNAAKVCCPNARNRVDKRVTDIMDSVNKKLEQAEVSRKRAEKAEKKSSEQTKLVGEEKEKLKESEQQANTDKNAYLNTTLALEILLTNKDTFMAYQIAKYNKQKHGENPKVVSVYENIKKIYFDKYLNSTFVGHFSNVNTALFINDERIITNGLDRSVKLWDVHKKDTLGTLKFNDYIYSIGFSKKHNRLIIGSYAGEVQIWDWAKRQRLCTQKFKNSVFTVAVSPDEESFLTGSFDGFVRLWDLKGNLIDSMKHDNKYVTEAIFSPDGQNVLSSSYDKDVKLWNIKDKSIRTFHHDTAVYSLDFSPDGKQILTSNTEGVISLWDLETHKLLKTFKAQNNVVKYSPNDNNDINQSQKQVQNNVVKFSPDSHNFFIGCSDNTMYMLNFDNDTIARFGHNSSVLTIDFSPNKQLILTGSTNGEVKIWDYPKDTKPEKIPSIVDLIEYGFAVDSADFKALEEKGEPKILKQLAQTNMNRKNFTEAYKYYERLYKQPLQDSADVRYNMWSLLTREDKSKITEATVTKATATKFQELLLPDDSLKLAQIYQLLEDDWADLINNPLDHEQKSVDIYEKRLKYNPTHQDSVNTARKYNSLAWEQIFKSRFSEALKSLNRGKDLNKDDLYLYTNLPHVKLFLDDFEAAKNEYLRYKDKPFGEQNLPTYKDAFLQDFKEFEARGLLKTDKRRTDVGKIKTMLESKEEKQ